MKVRKSGRDAIIWSKLSDGQSIDPI